MRRSGLPYLGHGVGLRVPHYARALEGRLGVDWVEVITENFFGAGGRPRAVLEAIRREVPLVFHGVSLGIGSFSDAARAGAPAPSEALAGYLRQVKALADAFEPAWISDHVCWTRLGERQSHDLLPLPFTEEALRVAVRATLRVQEALQRPIVLENVSSYVAFRTSEMSEWEFLSELTQRSGCSLLLDLNNVIVNASNHGFSPHEYLAGLPREKVAQFHLANHTARDKYCLDDHRGPVPPAVWSLYEDALRRFGPVSTLVEWDEEVPDWERLVEESLEAARRARQVLGERAELELTEPELAFELHRGLALDPSAQSPEAERAKDEPVRAKADAKRGSGLEGSTLGGLQELFFEALTWPRGVLDLVEARGSARSAIDANFVESGGLSAVARLDVYANAYFYRLLDAAAEMFPRLAYLAGPAAFHDLITDYVLACPSTCPNLHHLGDRLPSFIEKHALGTARPMLVEMATLELALLRALDGPDGRILTREALASLPPERWPSLRWSLAPAAQRVDAFHDLGTIAALCAAGERERALQCPRSAESVALLVSRRDHAVSFRTLEPVEALALDELASGCTFESLCELLAAHALAATAVHAYLQRWLEEALLSDAP
jgi:uncharacterized protein (UPF0276 family)